jgi:predicted TIM-barrel fold metal-dependent hydrolase
MENQGLPIIDCHQHFIDSRRLRYPVFMQRSAGFEALVGDYGALPRAYLPEDYARDVNGLGVVETVDSSLAIVSIAFHNWQEREDT